MSARDLTVVEAFSGGGGLSRGLFDAGFNVVSAIEFEPHAFATYKANHPSVKCLNQDIRSVRGRELVDLVGAENIDLLAGCPPCQGFTSLTSKYKKEDPRNGLIQEMSRLVKELKPQAVMIENVPGLATKGANLYSTFLNNLRSMNYVVNEAILDVVDFGVPQFRKRIVVLAGLGFKIEMPRPTHSKNGVNGKKPWVTVRDAIGMINEPPKLLADAQKRGSTQDLNWHIIRQLSPKNQERIKVAKPGKSWAAIPEALRPNCHKGSYKGFSNVYGRMRWDEPSPTITGGCTTLSKGRFGHPADDRTISVREAALLQTFPEDYIFDTPYMEHVCNIIGNALPPLFAKRLGESCYEAIQNRGIKNQTQ